MNGQEKKRVFQTKETELEDILKNNPWNEAEIKAWKNILKTGKSGEFILKADVDVIASYNRECKNEENRIQTHLLPQPFIGNPEAPIWILTQNPGYSEIDLYDMLGKKEEIKDWLKKEKVDPREQTESKESLEKRQELLLKQLRFKEPSFYVLDNCFNTLKEHVGNKSLGGYEWWNKRLLECDLCNGNKDMLSKFFVLEFFPYHSRNFSETLSKTEVAHSKFWKELVSYALDQKKPVIICGDMNVAHQEIDLKNPKTNRKNAGFTDEERQKMTELLASGFTDTFRAKNPDATDIYSWWSYRFKAREKNAGWRIDYFLVSNRLMEKVTDTMIYTDIFGSDHCPVGLEITL